MSAEEMIPKRLFCENGGEFRIDMMMVGTHCDELSTELPRLVGKLRFIEAMLFEDKGSLERLKHLENDSFEGLSAIFSEATTAAILINRAFGFEDD